ncbi:MAG TPA: site-specific integrase [Pyrinomonadaceae bacterium]|nr:site-specific integrase [Candidatus Limnocylindrales bacterium]
MNLFAGLGKKPNLPVVIAAAGERASRRFVEFFTANIRNKNTREAYARAIGAFLGWCDHHDLTLETIEPVAVAAYVEKLLKDGLAKPTVKQHLAAIRMLFDWMVTGGVLPFNPSASVRGPKYVIKKGKTPVLTPDEARLLLDSIDIQELSGLRDRALIGVMVYSFGRVSAVVGMNVDDYYQQGKRWWLRLHEKGGKHHEVPVHHKAEEYLDAYIHAAGIVNEKDVLQISGLLAGDVKELRNGNPTRDLQMAADQTRPHTLCGPVVSSLFSFAARC